VYHLFVVRTTERERVMRALDAEGIATGIHYPYPLHLSKPYEHLGYRAGDFPAAERAAQETLSLPMFPSLTIEQQERVAAALEVLSSASAAR
jgi:dTDP-4-amino-4,6-dideoxygalactose transaminase